MSQTSTVARSGAAPAATAVVVPPGAGPAVPPPQTPPPAGRRLRRAFEGTPGQLRTAAVVGVLVSLVFALVGGNAFRARGDALDQARDAAAQLVRVQQIATDLTSADAVVTNAFLQSGQEPPGAYETFQEKISDASTKLAEAARAEPGDATALAAVNQALAQYTADGRRPGSTTRSAIQVGRRLPQAGLRRCSGRLPRTSRPCCRPWRTSSPRTRQRVADAFAAATARPARARDRRVWSCSAASRPCRSGWARRTRRVFNVPMTCGERGLVLVTIVLGALVMIVSVGSADAVHDTSYAATKALAQARIARSTRRPTRASTLVDQSGSGQQYEKAYQADLAIVRSQLDDAGSAGAGNAGQAELAAWTPCTRRSAAPTPAGTGPRRSASRPAASVATRSSRRSTKTTNTRSAERGTQVSESGLRPSPAAPSARVAAP